MILLETKAWLTFPACPLVSFPLAVAGPAALIAGAAWVNAKAQLYYDYKLGRSQIGPSLKVSRAERRDQINLFYVLEQHATNRSTASSLFLIYDGKEWTFKNVYDIVLQYGTWLKTKYAIGPREVVAMDFMNGPQFIFLWLALWSLGACPAFINYSLTGKPLLHCIKSSTARIVFVDEEVKSQFTQDVVNALAAPGFHDGKGSAGSVQIVYISQATERLILAGKGVREPDSSRAGAKMHEKANLVFTSGTTGLPKPAIVSWRKSWTGPGKIRILLGLNSHDKLYTVRFHKSLHIISLYVVHHV
jgi:acyl-CoA synthetase (AMP-forming)/AMP-acid ligase II